jgi:uncharacterized protein YebE (UPF0316 family)
MSEAMATVGSAAITCMLAVLSVALWTLRVGLTAAGRRSIGAAVAGIEALVFTLAFSRIVANLDSPVGMIAYGLGVGLGTLLGVVAEERLSRGQSWVRVIVEGDGATLSSNLVRRRWPVTAVPATGPFGPVTELHMAVDDADLRALVRDIDAVAPEAFRTVERLRSSRGRPLPAGLRQVGGRNVYEFPGRGIRRKHAAGAARPPSLRPAWRSPSPRRRDGERARRSTR